ncbi:MAG: hypothetical protein LUP97_02410 [Methanoregula sp.]|nr:hypothetical protein [Methanoregula sp.]
MDKEAQPVRVKRDRPICERCQDPKIVERPGGGYTCKRCGYDSVKGR